ncbi:MAG TPA: MerR family transcriptional regulator [Deltaproteobacteria bacterium]|nr:MerR family transcriptional regulator [Deltaproteobacteria bacterium]
MKKDIDIPEKLFFRIGEVSKIVGVEPHVLRYWESEFKILRPSRIGSKRRLYRRKDIELILKIKELLYEKKFTIAGAKKVLKGKPVSLARGKMVAVSKDQLKEIIDELRRLRDFIE